MKKRGMIISNDNKVNYKVSPIEVKSSKNYTTTSLNKFKDIYNKKIGNMIIVHPKGYSIEGNIIKIPPYMLMCAIK